MKEIQISLTEEQEKFLRTFAEKQHPGAHDNLCTAYPIHAVETKRYVYVPYNDDITQYNDDVEIQFTTDGDHEHWVNDEKLLVEEWYENEEEPCPIAIKAYDEVEHTDMIGVDGEEHYVYDYDSYFKAYGIHEVEMCMRIPHYEPVAFFFILEEAKRYIQYQRHNLNQPRTYTYSSGYSNYGDFNPFWDLLMKMGGQLKQSFEEVKIAE